MSESDLPAEFLRITRYFRPLAAKEANALQDDTVSLLPHFGKELVISADSLVAGVHFLADTPADLIARKLLRVNLSDLAAAGAKPLGYMLCLSVPSDTEEAWFARFAEGLALEQKAFSFSLLGGDTTSSLQGIFTSVTVFGERPQGVGSGRRGARPADEIWVTGTLGDAALGLAAFQGKIPDQTGFLKQRYLLPEPRVGVDFHGIIRASADISDGLVQDLEHICRASGVRAEIRADLIPLSSAARSLIKEAPALQAVPLTGGDDYELLLAVPPEKSRVLQEAFAGVFPDLPLTKIGSFYEALPQEPPVTVRDQNNQPLSFSRKGWSHFS